VADLSDEQLLQMAAKAIGLASIEPGEYEDAMGPDGDYGCAVMAYGSELIAYGRAVAAATRAAMAAQPEPAAAKGPSIEDVGPLMSWLGVAAIHAANDGEGRTAGMLTWAAQVIGEKVDEDAPALPAQPEPSHDMEGEIAALMLTHSSVEPVMGTSRVLCDAAFGAVARAIAARWGRRPVTPEPTSPTLAEAREAARQLAGPAAQVVHQFLDALVR
jgi:hypothetical protein